MNRKAKLLCLSLAALLILCACGKTTQQQNEMPQAVQSTTSTQANQDLQAPETQPAQSILPVQTVPQEDVTIQTPYTALYFPGEWVDFLKTEVSFGFPCRVTFQTVMEGKPAVELFAIIFGDSAAQNIGVLLQSDGSYIQVAVEEKAFTPDETWTDNQANIVYSMKQACNYVLEHMPLENVPQSEETEPQKPDEQEKAEDMAIGTPYGELYYPIRWRENLSLQVQQEDGYSIGFYGNVGQHTMIHLFTLTIDGSGENIVGSMAGKPVTLELTSLEADDSWSAQERSTILAMQEDLNYLMGKLM